MSCEISDWTAHMHGDELHVVGQGECSTPDHELELVRGNEGIVDDPDAIVLELRISAPTGPVPEVITPVTVEYRDRIGDDPATVVHIRGDAEASVPLER